jgi:hypothetical protein
MRVKYLLAVLTVAAAAAAGASHAQTGDQLRWRCWYDAAPAPRVACRLLQWPVAQPQPVSAYDATDRLPPVVRRIRKAPETLADERLVIPLYGPPVEMRFVERLAHAVMCGGRTDCAVDFSAEPRED